MIGLRVSMLTAGAVLASLGLYYELTPLMAAGLILGIVAFVVNDHDDDGNYPEEIENRLRLSDIYSPAGAF